MLAMILAIATCVAGAHMARNDNFEKIPYPWRGRSGDRDGMLGDLILYRYSDWIKDRWVEK